jgi:hypothetical protein
MQVSKSKLRQRLWRTYQALGRSLRAMTAEQAMTPGSFYLLRRHCGKPNCRCARGQLHPVWVLSRSEAGRRTLYSIAPAERARVRQLARTWQRTHRARARFCKQTAALLALADKLAQAQTVRWPEPAAQTRSR